MKMLAAAVLFCLALWPAAPLSAQKDVLVDYGEAFKVFWDVPNEDAPNVTRRGDMLLNLDCAHQALTQARTELKGEWALDAYRALGVEILKSYIKGATAFGAWGQADEVEKAIDFAKKFEDYAEMALESDTAEEFAEKVTEKIGKEAADKISKKYGKDAFKKIWEYFLPRDPKKTHPKDLTGISCKVHIELQVTRPAAGQKGHLYFSALGTDCHCITGIPDPKQQPRSWRVIGNADLKFQSRQGDKFIFVIQNVTYEVGGECGCPTTTSPTPVTPSEPPPPPPSPTATPTPDRDRRVAEQKCKGLETEYQGWQTDLNNALRRCFAGDKKACEEAKNFLKKRDEARKKFCECAKKAYGAAKLPLPPEIEEICNPPVGTVPGGGGTGLPPTPTPRPKTPSEPCDSNREAYEKARQAWLEAGGNNPAAERDVGRAKRNYCDCLRRHFKGKLPPEVKKFCEEPASVFGTPPTFTTLSTATPATPTGTPATSGGTTTSPPAAGGVDSCLVGTWRSQTVQTPVSSGGAGIVLTINADGSESVDYKEMQPLKDTTGNTNLWAGTAAGYITAEKGKATLKSVTQSALTDTLTPVNGAARTSPISDLGPGALGGSHYEYSYTCDATTLTFKYVVYTLTFHRQGGATREKAP
jgi:hypothetical protein